MHIFDPLGGHLDPIIENVDADFRIKVLDPDPGP